MAWGAPCPLSDLSGARGRELLKRLEVPEPWRSRVATAACLVDDLDHRTLDLATLARGESFAPKGAAVALAA